MTAKRYIVFAFDVYYPAGGAKDIRLTTNDLEEAKKNAIGMLLTKNIAEVYDTVNECVVWSAGREE